MGIVGEGAGEAPESAHPLLSTQVPLLFREVGLKSGYRIPNCGVIGCVKSAFQKNNECMNFWTNFLPIFYFVWLAWTQAHCLEEKDFNDTPFLLFLIGGCCTFLLGSSMAHLFNVLSPGARHYCFFLDYFSLSQHSLVSGLAVQSYVLPGYYGSFGILVYAAANIFASITGLMVCISTRFIRGHLVKRRFLRTLAFAYPYIVINSPVAFKLIFLGSDCAPELSSSQCEHYSFALRCYHLQFIFIAAGILIYAVHLPELLFPYTFDVFGHSHQIFHVFGTMSTFFQARGFRQDMGNVGFKGDPMPDYSLPIFLCTSAINIFTVTAVIVSVSRGKMNPAASVESLSPKKTQSAPILPKKNV